MIELGKGSQKALHVILLQLIIVIYSLASVAAKFASGFSFISFGFIACYVAEIVLLAVYAILWQQAIKRFSLSTAYANRAGAVIWGLIWSNIIFSESISVKNLIGVLIIFTGLIVVNTDKEKMP